MWNPNKRLTGWPLAYAACVFFSSCHSGAGTAHGNPETLGSCMPAGVASDAVEVSIRLPAGCRFQPDLAARGSLDTPHRVASQAQLAQLLSCTAGATAPIFDLEAHDLWLATYEPLHGAISAVDDGTALTFVKRDVPPCPGDPHMMPGPSTTLGFLLPHGARRQFEQASCVLPRNCD